MTDRTPLSTFLFMTEGSSDKAYQVHLAQEGEGWIVSYANGRRGSPLKTGMKTAAPVPYEDALAVYTKVVKDKKKGGYTEEESGKAYAGTERAGDITGFQPKLLHPISIEEAVALLDAWDTVWMQIKRDGERRGALVLDGAVVGANRSGLAVALHPDIAQAVERICLGKDAVLDGEDLGARLHVFDLLAWEGRSLVAEPFQGRVASLQALQAFVERVGLSDSIRVDLPVQARSAADIVAYVDAARQAGEEGVVFVDGGAAYQAGRPARGGPVRKLKFVESATVRVAGTHPSKRSVEMEVQDGGAWRKVGSVTIPPNHAVPAAGDLVEVEYLYAYPMGSLFQPVYKGPRTDVGVEAARESQLKYKAGTLAEVAA